MSGSYRRQFDRQALNLAISIPLIIINIIKGMTESGRS